MEITKGVPKKIQCEGTQGEITQRIDGLLISVFLSYNKNKHILTANTKIK